jgi:hypothetical protein
MLPLHTLCFLIAQVYTTSPTIKMRPQWSLYTNFVPKGRYKVLSTDVPNLFLQINEQSFRIHNYYNLPISTRTSKQPSLQR